jgi:hypothetical protein
VTTYTLAPYISIVHVPSLHASRSPPAIIWAIIPIIIDSINRQLPRTVTHISQKVLKLVPAQAYGNAATSISVIARRFRVIASLNHACPNSVRPGFTKKVGSISSIMTAPTRLTDPISERSSLDWLDVSACASAEPMTGIAALNGGPVGVDFTGCHRSRHLRKNNSN